MECIMQLEFDEKSVRKALILMDMELTEDEISTRYLSPGTPVKINLDSMLGPQEQLQLLMGFIASNEVKLNDKG